MSLKYLPGPDGLFNEWGINFKDKTFTHQVALGLSPAQFAEIEDAANAFTAAYEASQEAKSNAHALVTTKDEVRAASEAVFRTYGQMIVNNPGVSTTLKGQLNLTIAPTPSGPVATPLDLSVAGTANGFNSLKWNRNGNNYTTTFIIEAKIGSATEWAQIGATTKASFATGGNAPGVEARYRVWAIRGSETSEPSNEAVVYSEDVPPLTLSEAA